MRDKDRKRKKEREREREKAVPFIKIDMARSHKEDALSRVTFQGVVTEYEHPSK